MSEIGQITLYSLAAVFTIFLGGLLAHYFGDLVWATGYNVVALLLETGFVPGLMIGPAFGEVLMSLSTVICVVNAQLLKGQMKNG